MKGYFLLFYIFICLFSITVLSAGTVNLKTETVFAESETDENTILPSPNNIAVDGKGNLYISDYKDSVIKKFSPDGKYLVTIGGKGEGPGEFSGLYFIQIIDDQIVATEFTRRQFFDLNGKFIKAEKKNELKAFRRLLYFDNGKSYVGYLADLAKSKYTLETGKFDTKNPWPISVLDAGRNARIESGRAYLLFTVDCHFDVTPGGTVYFAKDRGSMDVMLNVGGGDTRIFYTIKGSPAEMDEKERAAIKEQREKIKSFDIPDFKHRKTVKDIKSHNKNLYVWIETSERYGWLCIDKTGKETGFLKISEPGFSDNIEIHTTIGNDYIYYLINDPEKGAVVKRSKLPF